VLEGKVRITALDTEGGNFMDDLEKGDLWYFPSGHPHSLQGLAPGGTEFLLIFDDGNFSEESTFLLTDWLAHTPKNVISQNFRLAPEIFDRIPSAEKYIFQGSLPGPIDEENPSGSQIKKSKLQFTHRMLKQKPVQASGGTVRITDTSVFPLSKTVSAAHVTIVRTPEDIHAFAFVCTCILLSSDSCLGPMSRISAGERRCWSHE
jgi:oxalate decarboxylase family bicupin protein